MRKTKNIVLILGFLAISLSIGYLAVAWTEPGQPPPAGNVPNPLNASITAQSKEGALVLATNSGVTTGLIVQYGNVGIGTINPGAKLEVAGTGKFTGAVDMTSQKITSLAGPTDTADAATKGYVDAQSGGGSCYVRWGATSCASGYTAVYTGTAWSPWGFVVYSGGGAGYAPSLICGVPTTSNYFVESGSFGMSYGRMTAGSCAVCCK